MKARIILSADKKDFYKELFSLAIPIGMQNLLVALIGATDALMLGRFSQDAVSAVSLANQVVFIMNLFIGAVVGGGGVLLAQYWGKGDRENINRVIGIGCYVAGAISILFALVMMAFPRPLMGLLVNDAALVEIAADYARIVGPSYILNSITGVYVGAHRSMENPKLGLIIFSISMCTNTFLNWVLIFGNLGAPALGVVGAAAATLTSRVVEFVAMAIYALTNRRFRLQFALLLRPSRELVGKFVRYSSPVVLNETMWGLGTTLYKVIMGHMEGSAAILAARALAGNIEDICSVAIFAVAGSTAIIVGREIGAGRRDTVYEVGATMNTLALLCGGVLGGLLVLAAHFLLPAWVYPIFDLSARSAGIATMMLTFTGTTLALRAFNSTNIVGVLRGGGDVRTAMRIDILPLWAVALPLAALFGLALKWGIFWVYIGITMEQVSKFGFGVGRFRSRAWINDVTVARYQREETPSRSADT